MSQPRTAGHILIAEDEAPLAGLLAQHLASCGHRITSVSDGRQALRALHAQPFDVALLDIAMPAPDGLEVLRALADDPDPPAVIITTGLSTIDTAVQAMRLGAFAYVSKPYRIAELNVVVARALEARALEHENAALRAQVVRAEGAPEFVTQYAPLQAVYAAAIASAASENPVLIVGAPGTGKCALARAIHARSSRGGRPFVQLDQGALANGDADRALFGMDKSIGASHVRASLASRGTVYLHDLTVMAPRTQARLARALREGRFRNGGVADQRAVRARLIAAAPRSIEGAGVHVHQELVAALRGTCLTLPTLRERATDIPLLADTFLAAAGDAHRVRIDPDAMAALQNYSWPGNVAELRAVVERARLLSRDHVIRAHDLSLSGDHALELAEVERRHIAAVLESKEWHQGRAAESLGISPKTLYRKMREFGMRRPPSEQRR